MLARRSGSHLRSFQWQCHCQDLDLEKFSPELTEEPACLEERVKSWTGTVLQTRPTRRTGVTLDLLFQYFALSQLKIGHGDLAKTWQRWRRRQRKRRNHAEKWRLAGLKAWEICHLFSNILTRPTVPVCIWQCALLRTTGWFCDHLVNQVGLLVDEAPIKQSWRSWRPLCYRRRRWKCFQVRKLTIKVSSKNPKGLLVVSSTISSLKVVVSSEMFWSKGST